MSCKFILVGGPRKGQPCGKVCGYLGKGYCVYHAQITFMSLITNRHPLDKNPICMKQLKNGLFCNELPKDDNMYCNTHTKKILKRESHCKWELVQENFNIITCGRRCFKGPFCDNHYSMYKWWSVSGGNKKLFKRKITKYHARRVTADISHKIIRDLNLDNKPERKTASRERLNHIINLLPVQ